MSVYLPVAVKDLQGNVSEEELNHIGAYINSLFIFGWMFGGITWGFIGDRSGRTRSVIYSTACFGLFTLLTSFSPSWLWVSACRFMSGFGVGGVLVTTVILIAEIWDEKKRDVVLGILSIAFPVGIFSAGLINNLAPGWRQAFLIGAVPLFLAIISIWLLPESVAWKKDQSIISKQNEWKQLALPENRKNILAGTVIFGSMLIGLWAIFAWLPTWMQEILPGKDAQKERGMSMMFLGGGGLLGGFISGWLAKVIGGLKRTMILCFAGCFVLAFLLFKLNHSFSPVIYVEIALVALLFGISQGVLSAFIPQLFPVNVRAAATGFCFNIGRLFTATVVFFIGALESFAGGYGNAIFMFSFIFLAGLFAILFFKERKTA